MRKLGIKENSGKPFEKERIGTGHVGQNERGCSRSERWHEHRGSSKCFLWEARKAPCIPIAG